MGNVIPIEIYETEHKLEEKQQEFQEQHAALVKELPGLKEEIFKLEEEKVRAGKGEKGKIQARLVDKKNELKRFQDRIKLLQEDIDAIEKDIHRIRAEQNSAEYSEASETNVVTCLENLNANFIASESRWHCIYDNGDRSQPQVKVLDNESMKNMVLCETGWTEKQDTSIKEIAHASKRMYRDVERTFKRAKPGVLNQMVELQKFWLKPIYDAKPHPAIMALVENLADGDTDYMDFIERYVAYTYVKPHDIFAPNIDSSAKGGSGRDTFFRMLEIIFTEECCGEANKETFGGTHNGELWGKVLVKISEQNSTKVDFDQFKNLTGGHNFRLRRMGENAVQTARTFRFVIMSNRYSGTIPLTGKGRGSEDRRVEPIISLTSLTSRIAMKFGLNEHDPEDNVKIWDMLQDWQDNVFTNETEIARWLGYIIQKHKPETIKKLVPLHGKYYEQMKDRQKNAFNRFMEIVRDLSVATTCYDTSAMHKIFEISTCQKTDKNSLGKRMCQWMIDNTGAEWEVKLKDIYINGDTSKRTKRTVVCPRDVKMGPKDEVATNTSLMFDVFDFIEPDQQDDKGKDLDDKPHANNVKSDLL
jgi:hypothetical protein